MGKSKTPKRKEISASSTAVVRAHKKFDDDFEPPDLDVKEGDALLATSTKIIYPQEGNDHDGPEQISAHDDSIEALKQLYDNMASTNLKKKKRKVTVQIENSKILSDTFDPLILEAIDSAEIIPSDVDDNKSEKVGVNISVHGDVESERQHRKNYKKFGNIEVTVLDEMDDHVKHYTLPRKIREFSQTMTASQPRIRYSISVRQKKPGPAQTFRRK